jgi:hypothetical protein
MSKIPFDIRRDYIAPYTYVSQTIELREDIHSYYNVMKNTSELYSKAYPTTSATQEEDTAKAWLSNDICRFLNNDLPTMCGYTAFHIEVFQRLYINQSKPLDTIEEYITLVEHDSFPRDIKIVMGLLKPIERLNLELFLEDCI